MRNLKLNEIEFENEWKNSKVNHRKRWLI